MSSTPAFFPTVLAVATSVAIWLSGIVVITLSSLRSTIPETNITRRRWPLVSSIGSLAALWTATCVLARYVVANTLPMVLVQEFPIEFSEGLPTAAVVSDLILAIAWITGFLIIVSPPAVLWWLRSERSSARHAAV